MAQVWTQQIPDPVDPVLEPCFDVYKNGKLLRTHRLAGEKTSWIIGQTNAESVSSRYPSKKLPGAFNSQQAEGQLE